MTSKSFMSFTRSICVAAAVLMAAGAAQARDGLSIGIGAVDFGNGYSSFSGSISYRDRGDRFDFRFHDRGGYRDPWRNERHGWNRHWDRDRFRHHYRPPVYAYPYPPRHYWRPTPRGWYGAPYYYGPAGGVIVLGLFPSYFSARFNDNWAGYHQRAYARALSAPVGESVIWNDGGATGAVTTTRDGYAGSRYCREFLQDVTIAGERQQAYGTACQQPDGAWELVQNQR